MLLFAFSANAQYTYDVTGPFPVSNGSFNLSTNTSTAGFTDWHADDAGGTGNTWSAAYTIPFAFDYFGTPVTQFVVSKNYLLSFDTSLAGTTVKASLNNNSALPDTAVHDNTIAYYWDNFGNPAPLGTNDHVWIGVFGTAPNRQLWVRNWSYETEGRSFSYNNVVFEETTNKIYMTESYCSSAGVGSMTLGVQLNGSVAVQAPGSPALTSTTTNSAWASVTYWDFTPKLLVNDDASAISIDAPTNPITVGNQAVSATIANPGLNTLNTATVNWSVNGVTQTPVSLPAPLASNASASVSLGMFNFTGITTVDVWTSSPNGTVDANPANDTISETFYLGLSGTYTVDGSQASSATNFQSFADLENALTLGGLAGPVTVNVAPGTYTDPLLLSNIVGADSINNLLIDGGSSATTIMDGTGNFYTIAFEDMEFVTVQNMGIVNNGTTAMAVIFGPNSSNNTVKNCEIKVSTTSTSSLVNPIGSSNSLTTRSTNANGVDNNVVEDNRIVGGYYGVYFDGGSGNLQFGNQVLNNQIDSVYYYGVYGYYQDQMTVIGNTADVALRGNVNGDGIYGLYNTNGTFTDNYMHAIDYGFYISNSSTLAGPTYQKTLIANNMIISDTDYGMYLNSLDQVNLFHNSITAGGTSTPALQIQGSSTYPISRYDMRNNILASMNTEALEIVTVPDTFFTKCDNNAYYTTGATLIRANNTNYADLTAYKAVATTYNLASIEGDPQFLSATDLHIIGAFVNDLGDNSVGITTDIDGDTRPFPGATTVDIGADEFSPPLCPPVANLNTTNATLNSIDYYWAGTPGNTWEYEVTAGGAAQGTGTRSIVAFDSITVSGLSASTSYSFYVREICGRGDTSLWLGPVTSGTANGVPYLQTFDLWSAGNTGTSFPDGWTSTTTSNPRWETEDSQGSNENSLSTGPFYDNTNFGTPGGIYMYLETSGGAGNTAELISAPIFIDPAYTAVSLDFAYHMYGATMGTLNVYVEESGARTLLVSYTGQQQTAGGDPWLISSNTLAGYAGKSIQLVFSGTSGTSYTSDMSIDDVALNVLAPINAGVVSKIGDLLPGCIGSSIPVVGVKNFGTDTITTVKVLYDVNGTLDSVTYNGSILPGDTVPVTLGSISAPAPASYDFTIYTKDPNNGIDAVAADDTLSVTEVLLPAMGGVITGSDSICGGDTTTLTLNNSQGSLQWQELVGATWTNIPAAINSSIDVSPANITSYRALACGTVPSDTITVVPIVIPTPSVSSNMAIVQCGSLGTDTLIASSTLAGTSFKWYDAPIGGNLIQTSDTMLFTGTPGSQTMPALDTFYVSAATGGSGGLVVSGAHGSVFGGNARGYHFVAPVDFTITGLEVNPQAGSGGQHVAVLKTIGNAPWNIWSAAITPFTTLFLTQNNSTTGFIPCNIPVKAGDVIAILGQRGTGNSYGTGNTITIDGMNTPIQRFIMQSPLSSTAPANATQMGFEASANISNVNFTYAGGCEGNRTMAIAEVNCIVGLEGLETLNSLQIAPNPSNGLFKLNIELEEFNSYNLMLRDLNGKLIYEDRIAGSGRISKDLDFTSLSKGVYFMQIQSGKAVRVEKLIIQ